MQLTFSGTSSGVTVSRTLNVIPGSFSRSDLTVQTGGSGGMPLICTNAGTSGSCQVLADGTNFTLGAAVSLASGSGAGTFTISSPASCNDALVDVELDLSDVPVVTVSWRGNKVGAE